jgi:hypothetical protein
LNSSFLGLEFLPASPGRQEGLPPRNRETKEKAAEAQGLSRLTLFSSWIVRGLSSTMAL